MALGHFSPSRAKASSSFWSRRRLPLACLAILAVAFACARQPPTLQKEAVEHTLNGWLTAQSAPFFKALGQEPLVLNATLEVLSLPPPTEPVNPAEPPNPKEMTFFFEQRGYGLLMVSTKQSDQLIGTQGGGKARFEWDQHAWYLVNVQFRSGVEIADIHWKVEGY
ncbi:MAG: hypothetical protein PSU94_17240 [Lacunisphaera sp.]|nr:hypothetical protein [Lacunisphaera sp.]